LANEDRSDFYPPAFSCENAFGRLPFLDQNDGVTADLAFLGIPYDGLVTFRPGARLGPKAIRAASTLCRNYSLQMEVGVYETLRCVDAGDVAVDTFDFRQTFERIQTKVAALMNRGMAVVSLGGDHSVLLPILRAVAKRHPNPVLIQFDAHTDTSDQSNGQKYHHGTCVRRAVEEGLVAGERIFQIGIRGSLAGEDTLEFVRQAGIHVLDMQGFHDTRQRQAFIAAIHETAAGGPVYVTFDVDGIDPAFAPGTGTPVIGGLTSYEAVACLRALRGLAVVGGDVMEMAPPYDSSEITALLGAGLAYEIAALIAYGRAH